MVAFKTCAIRNVPATANDDRDRRPDRLLDQLRDAAAGHEPRHRREAEDAGEQRAHEAADAVHAEGVERVVVLEALLHLHRAVADGRGDGADDQRRRRDDVAGGRRDRHQAGDDARDQPRLVGRCWCHHSISIHVSAPAAAAVCVVANARPATWPATGCSAATALPALKPNQPNHSRPGAEQRQRQVVRQDRRAPRTVVAPRARAASPAPAREKPDEMWTTVPPAKSSTPYLNSQPPDAQTQCASGQ